MTIAFWKMHGAGNDFIVVDDRDETFPAGDRHWLQAVAHRNTGIGCDGFILVQNSDAADFRMRFLNSDGSLDDIFVLEDCGVAFLDDAAVRAFHDAQPFPNPPLALQDSNGRIHFKFGFYLEISGRRGFRWSY